MTIDQFFALDFATEFPDIFYDNKAIKYSLYSVARNHYAVDVTFTRQYINYKYSEFLLSPESRNIFIDWFSEYASSVISELYVIRAAFIL